MVLRRRRRARERTTGRPTSTNGASSLHLRWQLGGVATEIAATLRVREGPRVAKLYFWALQADFGTGAMDPGDSGRPGGGAHLGLQWHPEHPGSTAVNWGGYGPDGRELNGSRSALPSALRNANTRDYPWKQGVDYRLRIAPSPEQPDLPEGFRAWRGTVADLSSGVVVEVRDLYVPGDRITGAVMWSEVFADCDEPPVSVCWSDPVAVSVAGDALDPGTMAVNYQSVADGGCSNTNSWVAPEGWYQRTCTPRTTPQGTRLAAGPGDATRSAGGTGPPGSP